MPRLVVTTEPPGGLRALLDAAFGDRFDDHDWAHCLGGRHVVVLDGATPLAHAAVVPRTLHVGERTIRTGYVEGVATVPSHQRTGLGTRVVREAARLVTEHYDMGALSTGSPAFYERLGWDRWRGATYVIDGPARTRTPGDDGGVLVLRHGPTATLDLAGDLACEARPGDDW